MSTETGVHYCVPGPLVIATDIRAMWNNYSLGLTRDGARRRHEGRMWS